MATKGIDLTGKRFGRLTVLGIAESKDGVRWRCLCDCGNETIGHTGHLNAGGKISCGCAVIDSARAAHKLAMKVITIHGRSHTRLDECFKNMKRRCYDPKNKRYSEYGARGITVCDEWLLDNRKFFAWAEANGYAPDLTIDRIDNDLGYSPGNCRWADKFQQMNNMQKSHFLEWGGKRQTIAQWARELGVNPMAIQKRIMRKWPVERIFTQPWRSPRYPKKKPNGA
jgi:hypothetical protein